MANELPSCGCVGRRCDVAACHADDEAARSTSAASQRPAIICAGSQLDCLTFQFIAEIAVTSVIVRRAPFMCALAAPSYLAPRFVWSQSTSHELSLNPSFFLYLPSSTVCPTDHAAICAHCLSRAHTNNTNKLNQSSATGRVTCWHDGAPPCAVPVPGVRRSHGEDHPLRDLARTDGVYHPKSPETSGDIAGHAHTDPCWGAAAPPRTTDATTPRDTTRQKHDTPPTVYVDEKERRR